MSRIRFSLSWPQVGAFLCLLLTMAVACSAGAGRAEFSAPAGRTSPAPMLPADLGEPVSAVKLIKLADGLRRPVYLTHAGDERLFVAQQQGAIRIIQDGQTLAEPFLDIADLLATDGTERGLLGLAFHPNYAQNGFFYVVYTNVAGDTDLTRFSVRADDANRADPTTGQLILHVPQPFGNHNGGQLAFGPDGYLYAGFGDGGAVGDPHGNAQDPTTVLGSIVRIDVDGSAPFAIPADNPFSDRSGEPLPAWQIGLRNPWAFSFDAESGDLYIADVGQEGPEEVNFLPAGVAGANFGWPIREGDGCFAAERCRSPGFEAPVWTYAHDEGCAVIGGHVYRGQAYPALRGNYFFSDFCRGTLWALRHDGVTWRRNAVYDLATGVSALGIGADGALYLVTYPEGEVWRIEPTS